MAETSFTNKKVLAMAQNFVFVVAHTENGHGETEYVVGREKKSLCNEYYTIPCKTHQDGTAAIGRFFSGLIGTPSTVFADPYGNEIKKVTGAQSAGQLTKEMEEILGKVKGPKVPLAVWNLAKKMLEEGKAYLEEKEYKKAISTFTKLGKLRGSDKFKTMSREALDEVNDEGVFLLSEAVELDDTSKKRSAIRKVQSDFRGLPVAKQAYEELKKIK